MANAYPLEPIIVDTDEPDLVDVGESDISIALSDGNVVIDLNPKREDDKGSSFDDNLALKMQASELATLAGTLIEGIDADINSRKEWESTRALGIKLLGLVLEEPRGDVGASAPLEGMSRVRHPLLLEAVLRSQANASGELLPASGPAKIRNDGDETSQADAEAEDLEKGFNHYLTKTATEYYPDTRRTLFWSSFGGSGFKKLYHCPIRRRPVSESIDANDLIVSNAATDLQNAPRLTHRIKMPPSIMRRMQIVGAYRDVALLPPGQPSANSVDLQKQSVEGVRPAQERPEDQPYELYETYCELILDQYAPRQFKGKELPLPYKVTLDKDSRQVLEVRRFWDEDDPQCLRKKRIVKYPFVEGWGLYGIGLVHILGNSTNALTAAWREALDAGMFASFPGFLMLKSATKQLTNELRIPPGGSVAIDSTTNDIRMAAMALPYKDVTPGLMALIDKINEASQRVGGTAELPIGEGKQDAPVGTTLALLEQATKIESAVHKGLHQAQSEEFEILIELFREDPEAFFRHEPPCKTKWDETRLLKALDNCKLVPVADPNTPSHMHRIAKALAIKQLQAASPQLYDPKAVDTRVLRMIKVDDLESLFAPPQPPPGPDPLVEAKGVEAAAKLIQAQTGAQKVQIDANTQQAKLADAAEQRQADKDVATLKLAQELVIHQNDATESEHRRTMDLTRHAVAAEQGAQKHGLAVEQALHGATMAERQHTHDTTMDHHRHALDVHSTLNPPQPKPPKPKQ